MQDPLAPLIHSDIYFWLQQQSHADTKSCFVAMDVSAPSPFKIIQRPSTCNVPFPGVYPSFLFFWVPFSQGVLPTGSKLRFYTPYLGNSVANHNQANFASGSFSLECDSICSS